MQELRSRSPVMHAKISASLKFQASIRGNRFLIHLARRSREPDASHLRRNGRASTAKPVVDQVNDVAGPVVWFVMSRSGATRTNAGSAVLPCFWRPRHVHLIRAAHLQKLHR